MPHSFRKRAFTNDKTAITRPRREGEGDAVSPVETTRREPRSMEYATLSAVCGTLSQESRTWSGRRECDRSGAEAREPHDYWPLKRILIVARVPSPSKTTM